MRTLRLSIFLLLVFAGSVLGANADELQQAYNRIASAQLDSSTTLEISGYTINHHNLELHLQSGRLTFFEPVFIDSQQIYFGAYFTGMGVMKFAPDIMMEQDQLERFTGKKIIDVEFKTVFMLFNQEIYQNILEEQFPHSDAFSKNDKGESDRLREKLLEDPNEAYIFNLLKSLINPTPRPFLIVNIHPDNFDHLFYLYNPFEREEVKLYKEYKALSVSFMELVNSYSQYNIDESYHNINGRTKDQIKVESYDIEASIDAKGVYRGKTKMTFEVTSSPLQCLTLNLNKKLSINAIYDSQGRKVNYIRHKLKSKFHTYEVKDVNIIFEQPLNYSDKISLEFDLEGKLLESEMGELYIQAGADWYPRYGFLQRAVFDMKFKTDVQFAFVAAGNKISSKVQNDTLFTSWIINLPTSNVSFNIGNMKKYLFESSDVVPVEIYYSKNLHKGMATYLGSELIAVGNDMEEQIAEDVMNSIRVFQHYFGPYAYDKLVVGEILSSHGEAFPAFLHLGFDTWINTDRWGNDRIFRSHEVAHQWWGVQVGYETYHDQWLSEGLATYSSLMYYQAISENKDFLNKLKDFRNDIFSVRKYFLGSGEESGPVALGYRTSSTETKGDFNLIIYKKGAFIFHMLRNMMIDLKTMNEDLFLGFLKEFYSKYRGKNATTLDLQLLAEQYTGIKLDWFFNQWVNRNELPTYEFTYDYEKDSTGNYVAHGKIITKNVSPDFKMYVPLEIQIDKDNKAYVRLFVDKPVYEFDLPGLPQKPKKLILNPFESVLAKID